jgi:dephospho-CoA kinase
MLKIGLTGGIGSGKSTVARLFAERGIPVLDADQIARELVEPGQPALDEIVRAFGKDVLIQGHLDRARLRELVFQSQERKKRLETILHPLVYRTLNDRLRRLDADYCILVVPLLLETAPPGFVDRTLVIDCPVETQWARVRQRDGLDDATIDRILLSQISRNQRLAKADDVIDNSGEPADLHAQVARLHERYRRLAHAGQGQTSID